MHNGMAVAALVVGLIGVIVAVAVRTRWARPVGAALLILAVVTEVFVLSSPASKQGAGGDGDASHSLPPTSVVGTTTPLRTTPTATSSGQPLRPHLLAQVHPGNAHTDPIIKANSANKEFVRLTNSGSKARALGGWRLSNGSVTFVFPPVTLPAHASLVVRTGPGTGSATVLHWGLGTYVWHFPNGVITLRDASGRLINTCRYRVAVGESAAPC